MTDHVKSISEFNEYVRTSLKTLEENEKPARSFVASPVITELLKQAYDSFDGKERTEALSGLFDVWRDYSYLIVSSWAQLRPNERELVFDLLDSSNIFVWNKRPIKTVAIHMRNLFCGGAETVGAAFANWLTALKDENGNQRFKVVILTDEEPSEHDRELDERITRCSIPEWSSDRVNDKWAEAVVAAVEQYEIDLFIQNITIKRVHSVWDLLLMRSCARRPAFIQRQNTSFLSFIHVDKQMEPYYHHPDALISETEFASKIWSAFNPRTFAMCNLPTLPQVRTKPSQEGDVGGKAQHSVLWVNRLIAVKKPLEFLRIAQQVSKRLPDVHFDIVGEADDLGYKIQLEEKVSEFGLQDRVTFHGFQEDPSPFYARSSVFLMTSGSEGYSNVLYEAASFALPVVMYELPELDFNDQFPARRAVTQRDSPAAADEIIHLLTDSEYYAKIRHTMRSDYERFIADCETKLLSSWNALIDSLETGAVPEETILGAEDVKRMMCAIRNMWQAEKGAPASMKGTQKPNGK